MTSNTSQPGLILELLNFLLPQFESQNAVQVIALQNLLQFTPTANPNRHLFSQRVPEQQQTWITVIANACKRESLGSVGQHAAINILVNLTDGVERVNAVLKDAGWLEWAVKTILVRYQVSVKRNIGRYDVFNSKKILCSQTRFACCCPI